MKRRRTERMEKKTTESVPEYIKKRVHDLYWNEDVNEFDNNSGFAAEYDLTSDSELVDLCLQMKFLYQKSGLKSVFVTIDPQ